MARCRNFNCGNHEALEHISSAILCNHILSTSFITLAPTSPNADKISAPDKMLFILQLEHVKDILSTLFIILAPNIPKCRQDKCSREDVHYFIA